METDDEKVRRVVDALAVEVEVVWHCPHGHHHKLDAEESMRILDEQQERRSA